MEQLAGTKSELLEHPNGSQFGSQFGGGPGAGGLAASGAPALRSISPAHDEELGTLLHKDSSCSFLKQSLLFTLQ